MAGPDRQVRNRRRKQERPDEILEAAVVEFLAHGFDATRVEQVARRAGVAKGTVYLYFPSKGELFKAVVRRSIAAQFQALRETARVFTGSTEELLRGPLRQFLGDFLRSDARALAHVLVAEAHLFPDLAEFYYREVIAASLSVLRFAVARGEAAGELCPTSLPRFPQVLLAPASMVIVWEALFGRSQPLDREALLDVYLDLLLGSAHIRAPRR